MKPILPNDRFRLHSVNPMKPFPSPDPGGEPRPRWLLNFEVDIPAVSIDRYWDGPSPNLNAVLRFVTFDAELVRSLTPGDRFRLDLTRIGDAAVEPAEASDQ